MPIKSMLPPTDEMNGNFQWGFVWSCMDLENVVQHFTTFKRAMVEATTDEQKVLAQTIVNVGDGARAAMLMKLNSQRRTK